LPAGLAGKKQFALHRSLPPAGQCQLIQLARCHHSFYAPPAVPRGTIIDSPKSTGFLLRAAQIQVGHTTFKAGLALKTIPHALWLQTHVYDWPNPSFYSDPTGTGYRNISWN